MASVSARKDVLKLLVTNLPWTVGNTELKQYFSQFGHVAVAKVLFNHTTGMSKYRGIIVLSEKTTYESILNKQHHKLEGRVLSIKTSN